MQQIDIMLIGMITTYIVVAALYTFLLFRILTDDTGLKEVFRIEVSK